MSSLRNVVSKYQDNLQNGIEWPLFVRENERGGVGCQCAAPLWQKSEQHCPIYEGPQRRAAVG